MHSATQVPKSPTVIDDPHNRNTDYIRYEAHFQRLQVVLDTSEDSRQCLGIRRALAIWHQRIS